MENNFYTPAELNAHAFVSEPRNFNTVHNSYIEKCMIACKNKSAIDENIKLNIQQKVNEGISVSKGFAALAGWSFDFRPYLKRYVVKQYNRWNEYYAFNRTLLRKMIYGRIQELVEIPEK